jgi:hypothetical protein
MPVLLTTNKTQYTGTMATTIQVTVINVRALTCSGTSCSRSFRRFFPCRTSIDSAVTKELRFEFLEREPAQTFLVCPPSQGTYLFERRDLRSSSARTLAPRALSRPWSIARPWRSHIERWNNLRNCGIRQPAEGDELGWRPRTRCHPSQSHSLRERLRV